jgi:CPA2 family monovalent cation:H+ antiporter-2
LGELELARVRVEVTAVRRRNVRTTTPAADTRIEENDVVVLLGAEEDVAAAEMKLVQG